MPYGVCVAWIRRVWTGSGATAVQIAESVGGRRRLVAHVGPAHSEAELGIEPASPEMRLVGTPAEPALFAGEGGG